jgi:hypothetical protein
VTATRRTRAAAPHHDGPLSIPDPAPPTPIREIGQIGTQFFAARTRPGKRIAVSLVTIGDGVETAQVTVPTSGDTAAGFTYENPLG